MNRRKFFQGLAAAAICASSLVKFGSKQVLDEGWGGDLDPKLWIDCGRVKDLTFTVNGESVPFSVSKDGMRLKIYAIQSDYTIAEGD